MIILQSNLIFSNFRSWASFEGFLTQNNRYHSLVENITRISCLNHSVSVATTLFYYYGVEQRSWVVSCSVTNRRGGLCGVRVSPNFLIFRLLVLVKNSVKTLFSEEMKISTGFLNVSNIDNRTSCSQFWRDISMKIVRRYKDCAKCFHYERWNTIKADFQRRKNPRSSGFHCFLATYRKNRERFYFFDAFQVHTMVGVNGRWLKTLIFA